MQTITVNGRRWFQRTYGNTYHSVAVHVDGEFAGAADFRYGYGDQYKQTAMDILQKHGHIPATPPGERTPCLWVWCRDNGVALVCDVADVARKKDL